MVGKDPGPAGAAAAGGLRTDSHGREACPDRNVEPWSTPPAAGGVLLHGIGRSLEDWTEQHELLRARHRVYSMDLAGSGWSEPLDEPYTLPALARFVVEFLDAVKIAKPAHVVGNSLGGAVAIRLDNRERSKQLPNKTDQNTTV